MKNNCKIWLICLFTFVTGLVSAQTYTISPTGWTSKPVGTISSGSTTFNASTTDGIYITARAVSNGDGTITIYAKKSSGSFQNSVTARAYKNLTYSGGSITSMGTAAGQGKAVSGDSQISFDVTPGLSSGSCTYTLLVISNGSTVTRFYTFPITVKAASAKLPTPDYTTFYASEITSTSFKANWGKVSGATQYYINIREVGGQYPSTRNHGSAGTSYTFTNLTPGTSYEFQVKAINNTQESDWSKSIQTPVTTTSNKLATPDYTKFTATNITTTGFTAKWSSVSGATKYGILVRKVGGSYSDPEYENEVSSTSCDVTGLQPGQSYEFQIQARNGYSSQKSDWSKSIQTPVTTANNKLPTPDYTTFTYSDVTSTSFVAHWGKVSGATQYYINIREVGGQYPSTRNHGSAGTSYTFTNLTPGTSYEFQVKAINNTQESDWSKSIQTPVKTLSAAANLTLSMAPTFGSTNLTKGKPYNFVTKIKNTGTSSWTGYFFVKPVGTDNNWIRTENPVTISSGKEYSLTGSYTPTATGTYSIGVHYLTKGETSGDLVSKGSYPNPITVTVTSSSSSVPSLTLVSAMSFDSSNLIVGKQHSFSANVKNTGTSSWTGRFYVKCDGENLIAIEKPRTLSVGDVTLISGTYTPTSTGTKRIELYYKTETESSGALVSAGSYTNPITVTISSSQTASANLTLSMAPTFGSTNLTKGKPYNFVTKIKNNGTSSWTGYFFVKPVGSTDNWVRTEDPVTINSGKEYSLTGSYTPTATGTYSIGVHYLTKGETSGDLVSKGSYSNPITITVTESSTPTYYYDLKLKTAISAPSTLTVGNTGSLSATVTNSGNKDWSGTLYIYDNGTTVAKNSTTISKSGGFASVYTSSWKPTTAGQHEISVRYVSSNSSSTELVGANGYSNPVNVTVNSSVTTKKANLTLITKGLAPTAVAAGSEVYYHYRITDENYYRLSGVKLVYEIISNYRSGSYISEASDENGLVTLTLSAEEGMAGGDVQIVVKSLQDSQGNKIEMARETADGNITLAVKPIANLQNIESAKIELEPGIGAEWGIKNFMKVNAGGSFPISVKWNYEDDGSLRSKTVGVGAKVGGGGKLDFSINESMDEYTDYYGCSVGADVHIGGDVSVSAKTFSRAILCAVLALADRATTITHRWANAGIQTIRKIYEYKFKPSYETDWFFDVSGSLNAKFLDKSPKSSTFHNSTAIPGGIGISELNGGVSGTLKFTPLKFNNDTENGVKTYSRSVSVKLNGNAKVKASFENTFFANKSWWKAGRLIVQPSLFGPETFFKFGSASADLGISLTEEEEYNDRGMTSLKSISNKFSLTNGKKISIDDIGIKTICNTLNAEGAYKTTASTKLKSGSNWVNYIRNVSAQNSSLGTYIKRAYPILTGQYLFTSPSDLYNVWRNDYLSDLTKMGFANSSFNIKDVLKVEHTNSSEVMMQVKIPIIWWKDFYFELGATVSAVCFPSESYFSPEDNTFLPVVARPSSTIIDIAKDFVGEIIENIKNSVDEDEQEINDTWDGVTPRVYAGSTVGTKIVFTNRGQGHQSIQDSYGKVCRWAARRHPQLAAAKQEDICTFAFTINDQTQNFDAGVNLAFQHFYPAGDLLAVTDQGDTLFVVSEVCDLSAMVANQNLSTSQHGQFKMETVVGADDLTPFGLPKDLKLDVYQADEGSDIWHYVGPAGTTTMVNSLGSYIMATSIKNDVQKPQISITVDNTTGIMRLFIKDNIGLKKKTLQVLVNGSLRTLNAIDEWNYALKLSSSDMQGTMTVYVTVDDLAGNNGHVFRIFDMGPSGIVGVEKNDSSDQSSISVRNGAIVVSDSKPDTRVAVFTLDGKLVVEGQTDASGVAVLHQPIKRMGVYVVTLSDGTTQKVYIK